MALALSNGDVILLVVALSIPLVLISFLGAGEAFKQIGKGPLSIEQDFPQKATGRVSSVSAETRETEIRQFLEGKAFRQAERGEEPLDVERELARLLDEDGGSGGSELGSDPELVAEVRQLVEASNARRIRMGRDPIDVDREVERQLAELESLGQ